MRVKDHRPIHDGLDLPLAQRMSGSQRSKAPPLSLPALVEEEDDVHTPVQILLPGLAWRTETQTTSRVWLCAGKLARYPSSWPDPEASVIESVDESA